MPSEASSTDAPLLDADGAHASAGDDDGDESAAEEAGEARRMATIQRLSLMTVSEKIKAAMRGSREERTS